MRHQRRELTLKNALSDPLVQTVMAADGVDPQQLSSMLNEIVATLDRRATSAAAQHARFLAQFPLCNDLRLNTLQ